MPWVLLDVLIGLFAVLFLGVVAFALYRHIRVLMRAVGAASARVSSAMPPSPAPRT